MARTRQPNYNRVAGPRYMLTARAAACHHINQDIVSAPSDHCVGGVRARVGRKWPENSRHNVHNAVANTMTPLASVTGTSPAWMNGSGPVNRILGAEIRRAERRQHPTESESRLTEIPSADMSQHLIARQPWPRPSVLTTPRLEPVSFRAFPENSRFTLVMPFPGFDNATRF